MARTKDKIKAAVRKAARAELNKLRIPELLKKFAERGLKSTAKGKLAIVNELLVVVMAEKEQEEEEHPAPAPKRVPPKKRKEPPPAEEREDTDEGSGGEDEEYTPSNDGEDEDEEGEEGEEEEATEVLTETSRGGEQLSALSLEGIPTCNDFQLGKIIDAVQQRTFSHEIRRLTSRGNCGVCPVTRGVAESDFEGPDFSGASKACLTCGVRLCNWTQCLSYHVSFCSGHREKRSKVAKWKVHKDQYEKKEQKNKGKTTAARTAAQSALHARNRETAAARNDAVVAESTAQLAAARKGRGATNAAEAGPSTA